MKKINYSSKGLYIKKLNNSIMLSNFNYKENKKELLKLNFFKNINLFTDFVMDIREDDKFTKNYIIESKKVNKLEKILEEDIKLNIVFPDKTKNLILSKFNPEKNKEE